MAAGPTGSRRDAAALETVFASSNGDGAVVGAILETLSDPAGAISPTDRMPALRCASTTPTRRSALA